MGTNLNWEKEKAKLKAHRQGGYWSDQFRYASDKQKNFIKKLLEQKQHNYNDVDLLDELNVQGATDLIAQLLSLPDKENYVATPTNRQLSFAKNLIQNREGGMELLNQLLQTHKVNSLEQLSKAVVSGIINTLKSNAETPLSITEVGAYLYDGIIYSIRQGKETKRFQVWSYSKDINKYVREPNSFAEKELLKKLQPTDRLTLELAIKYSAQTGICCHCGRTLTLLKSVASGMGAWCASKYK